MWQKIFISLAFGLGFIIRIYLASFAPISDVFDTASYNRMAKELLAGVWAVDCCDHNPGYSLFLFLIYRVFGVENFKAVQHVQILIDLVSAILLLCIGRKMFGKTAAVAGFMLYILNPFTASYTGLILTETVTIFYLTAIAYILTKKMFNQKARLWLALGLLLGLLQASRLTAMLFVLGLIGYLTLILFRKKKRAIFFLVVWLGFLIGASYPLIAYYKNFQKISFTPPYSLGAAALYFNFYNIQADPEIADENWTKVNPDFNKLVAEYHRTYYLDTPKLKTKYYSLFVDKMKNEWPKFFKNVIKNMVWIWDKNHLFTYKDPFYPQDKYILTIINTLYIVLFFIGIGSYVISNFPRALIHPVVVGSLLFFFSITFLFTLVSNTSRHSLTFYSLLTLWAGKGVIVVMSLTRGKEALMRVIRRR